MSAYVAAFDVASLPPGELRSIVGDAAIIGNLATVLASRTAARMADGAGQPPGTKGSAERLAAENLAKASGTSFQRAKSDIEAARALASQPQLDAAARAGKLSRDQASLLRSVAEVDPEAAQRLVDRAGTVSLSELAAEAARARAAVGDAEARLARVHAQRSLRTWTDPEGMWHLQAKGTPQDGARIMAAVRRHSDIAFQVARKEGRRDRADAYAFDGLVTACASGRAPGAASPTYEIMVRVDYTALMRGQVIDGETCEIAGFGPVTPQVLYDILESSDPFLKCIVTRGKEIVGVAHLGRRPTTFQKSALDWLFPTCAAEGCGIRAQFLQSDHRVDWAKSHITVFDLLDRLCPHHHRLKTRGGWSLVDGRGKRAFVAPDDERHPARRARHREHVPELPP